MTRKYDATQLYMAVLVTVLLFAILACVPAHSQLPATQPATVGEKGIRWVTVCKVKSSNGTYIPDSSGGDEIR